MRFASLAVVLTLVLFARSALAQEPVPFDPTELPINPDQVDRFAEINAELAKKYEGKKVVVTGKIDDAIFSGGSFVTYRMVWPAPSNNTLKKTRQLGISFDAASKKADRALAAVMASKPEIRVVGVTQFVAKTFWIKAESYEVLPKK
jgi:hypothetical protein